MKQLKFIIIAAITIILIGFASTSDAVKLVLDEKSYGLDISQNQGMIFNAAGTLTCPDGSIQEGAAFPTNYLIPMKEDSNLMATTNLPLFINEDPNAFNYYNLEITNVQVDSEKFFINFVGATTTDRTPLCNFTDQGLTNFVMYGHCDGSEFAFQGGNGISMNVESFDVACG